MTKDIGIADCVDAAEGVLVARSLPGLTGSGPGVNLLASTLPPSIVINVGGIGATVMLGGIMVIGSGVGVSVASGAPHEARITLMPSGAIRRNGERGFIACPGFWREQSDVRSLPRIVPGRSRPSAQPLPCRSSSTARQ